MIRKVWLRVMPTVPSGSWTSTPTMATFAGRRCRKGDRFVYLTWGTYTGGTFTRVVFSSLFWLQSDRWFWLHQDRLGWGRNWLGQ